MYNYKFVKIKEIAKTLKVHNNTLNSWLGHYSLSKYVLEMLNEAGKLERYFRMSKTSAAVLRRYLTKKNRNTLTLFDNHFKADD